MEDVYYNPLPYPPEQFTPQLKQKLRELEDQVEALQKQLNDTLKTPEVHYHYSFDQLKIERLEGTLNIGMPSQSDASSLDDFTVEDQSIHAPSASGGPLPATPLNRIIENELIQYTEQILTARKQSDEWVMMPHDMEQLIINDIKQQLPERIAYYMKRAANGAMSEEDAKATALQACKKDIDKALKLFLSKQMNKGADINEI